MSKCECLGNNGICSKLSDSEVKQPRVEGSCEFDTTGAEELKNCPFCGKSVEVHVHPERDDKVGLVYGALIIHKECIDGMEVELFSIHYKKTEEEARETLTTAWNTRTASPRFTEVEREAMNHVIFMAMATASGKRDGGAIATVRKMLEGSV